jgi:hypothetical protein
MSQTGNPDVASLTSYAGKYKNELITKMYSGLTVTQDVAFEENVENQMTLTELELNVQAREFSSTEEIDSDTGFKYTPRVLTVNQFKLEMRVDPTKYRRTYLQQVRSGVLDKSIPYAQFHNEMLAMELGQQINTQVAYYGIDSAGIAAWASGSTYAIGDKVKLANANGVLHKWIAIAATTAGQSPLTHPAKWKNITTECIAEGFKSRILSGISNSDITQTSFGSNMSASNGVAYVENLMAAVSTPVYNSGVNVYMSRKSLKKYNDDYREKYGKYTGKMMGKYQTVDDNEKVLLVPAEWMMDSKRIIVCRPSKLVVGTNKLSDFNNVVTSNDQLWTYKQGNTGLFGTQIESFNEMVINDEEA